MDKPWTVLLLYPTWAWDSNNPDVYINHATAPNEKAAAHDVMKMAEEANGGAYDHEDFHVLAIFEGHIDACLIANDF
jgi:hypothetical protein